MGEEIARATIRLTVDDLGLREEVRAKVDAATAGQSHDVRVGADTGEATAKLAALDAEVRKVDRDADSASRSLSSMGGGVNAIGLGIAAALPAVPTLLGGVGAIAGAFTAAGGAALASGGVIVTSITQAVKANQELASAQKAVDDATTASGRNKALAEQAALIDKLGPGVIAFGQALQSIATTWKSFTDSFLPQEIQIASGFERLEKDVLPALRPLLANTFAAAQQELGKLDAAVNSPGGKSFFSWLSVEGPHDLQVITDGVGHFAAGLGHLLVAFTPVERQFVAGFDNIGKRFQAATANLDSNANFQKFLAQVAKDGPLLVHTLGDVAAAVGHIGLALGPILPLELKFIDGIATLINDHPAIASALGAMFLGFESLKVIGTLLGPLQVFAAGLGAIGLSARGAAGETAGLAGRLAGLASIGEIVIPIVLAISVKEGLDAGSSALKKSDNPFKHLAGDVLGALSGGGMPGTQEFTNNILDAGNFIAGGTSDTAASDANLARLGGLSVTSAPPQPSGPGLFSGLVNTISGITSAVGRAASDSSVTSLASFFSPLGGVGSGALPLSGGGGSNAAATAAQNNAAALAYLMGISIPTSLAQGIASGTNPLTETFQNLNQKLSGSAQTLANTLEGIFNTALQYGQAAQQSLLPNVATGLPQLGTMTNITVGPDGKLVTTQASPILGGLQLTLANDQRFVADVGKARKLGLSDAILRQFVSAGPSSLDQLDALVNGSAGDIASINATYGQITALGNQYGNQQAQLEYLSEMSGDLKTLIAAVAGLIPNLPPAIGKQVAAALNGLSATAQLKAQNTPSKGVLAR